jgi:cytochrome c oxidase subunit 1
MGLTYYVVPLIWRRRILWPRLATFQAYAFGIGVAVFAAGMTTAGSYAIPRRHWDVQFTAAAFQPPVEAAAHVFLGVMGLGGLLAAVGGALYVLITVASVLFGPRIPDEPGAFRLAPVPPARGHTPISGTLVLVLVFLAAFVVYYFLNWKWLAAIWLVK